MADGNYRKRLLVRAVRRPGFAADRRRRQSRHGRARTGVNWPAHACAACASPFRYGREVPDQA